MGPSVHRSTSLGDYYARLVAGRAGVREARILAAFEVVPRETFLEPGPWPIATLGGYVLTPSDDPAFLYADVVVGLLPERSLNNGEPSFHARCLEAAAIQPGETVVHVGAGAGYYSAIMAELAGPEGRVEALEIDEALAARAARNLRAWPQARVTARSGLEAPFPAGDVIYVNAGVTQPAAAWLEALAPGGRLVLPMTSGWWGMVLLLTARSPALFEARVVCPTGIIPCVGGQDEAMARRLSDALRLAGPDEAPRAPRLPHLRSLRRASEPDDSCWLSGEGWWLSTAPLEPDPPSTN